MSVADKLTKLATDINSAYSAIQTKGGTVPEHKNTENLADAIGSISGGGGVGYNLEPFPTVTLPTGYTRLEWIENQDYQSYIDTGVVPTIYTNFEIELMRTSVYQSSSGGSQIFGRKTVSNSVYGVACSAKTGYTSEALFGGSFTNTWSPANVNTGWGRLVELPVNEWHKFSRKFNELQFDDNKAFSEQDGLNETGGPTCYVMQLNLRGGLDNYFNSHRVKYLAFWEKQKITHYFVPCTDDQSRVGLYDMVGEQFYPKQGTGAEFIAGPAVSEGNA